MTGGRRLVAGLAVSQTIAYGTLYYAFAVLLTPLAADLHTSTTTVTGAFTANVITSALLAVPIGRWLDRHGGRALMTAGSAGAVLLLVALAHVTTVTQLYLVQIGIGAVSAASLYEAAFAVVIAFFGAERRAGAVLAITVVAGFASSIFLPVTGWLVDAHGWRHAVLILTAIQAVTVPVHLLLIRRPAHPPNAPSRIVPSRTVPARDAPARNAPARDAPARNAPARDAPARDDPARGAVRDALADRAFWLLVLGFTAHTAAVSTLSVHLIAALVSWGHPPAFAATIAGLLGVLSVAGRLLTTRLHQRYRTTTVTAAVFAVQAVAALLLPVVGASTGGAVGAVIGLGIGFGVATIAKPLILAERYDTRRYATLAGILVVPMTLAKAVAPLGMAALHTSTGSYTPVLHGVAACCALGATAIAAVTCRSGASADRSAHSAPAREAPRPRSVHRTGPPG